VNRSLADQTGFTSLKVPYEKPPSQYRPTLPHTRPQSEDPGLQGKRLTRLSCDAVTMAVAIASQLEDAGYVESGSLGGRKVQIEVSRAV
jgi:hypothetical protein